MKNKMRFSRSLADITSVLDKMLPHSIQEEFPLNFDHDLVLRLVEKQMRSKRSINGSPGDNHHHHHDHHHEEDRGCTILGVYYQLGEVIGKFFIVPFEYIIKTQKNTSSLRLTCKTPIKDPFFNTASFQTFNPKTDKKGKV